jgi:hypothetical protein
VITLVALLVVVAAAAATQELFRGWRSPAFEVAENPPYDGRVTFVRIRYATDFGSVGGRWARDPGWAHDYPTADIHMMKILHELTLLRPRIDASNIFSLSDPELHKHPFAYMSEPGFWVVTEEEGRGLRSYLQKGGFIVFDDFRGRDWDNLVAQMRQVLPDALWFEIDPSHPVFHSFFEIDDPASMTPPYGGMPPLFYGLFEDNDRHGRLLAVANVNNDLGEYWEFSDTGYAPVDLSNQAYKFGVNYYMYALTH